MVIIYSKLFGLYHLLFKSPDDLCDLGAVLFEHKMPAIEIVHFDICQIFLIALLDTANQEERIVLTPHDKSRRLVLRKYSCQAGYDLTFDE